MGIKILIAEDEYRIRRLISDYLKKEGYETIGVENGEEALDRFYSDKFDLIILDIMMPKIDGWKVCQKIRGDSDIPIVMLPAKSEEEGQLSGYSIGATEYVLKPFSPKILIAKVKSILSIAGKLGEEVVVGEYKVDVASRKVFNSEQEIELTPKEYELLSVLINNKGVALSRERILDKIWGFDYFGDLRTVDTHIKRLRKKLKKLEIETVRGYGYRYGD